MTYCKEFNAKIYKLQRKLEREICFLYAVAVDGFEIVTHRDDDVTAITPLVAELKGFVAVGMVTRRQ